MIRRGTAGVLLLVLLGAATVLGSLWGMLHTLSMQRQALGAQVRADIEGLVPLLAGATTPSLEQYHPDAEQRSLIYLGLDEFRRKYPRLSDSPEFSKTLESGVLFEVAPQGSALGLHYHYIRQFRDPDRILWIQDRIVESQPVLGNTMALVTGSWLLMLCMSAGFFLILLGGWNQAVRKAATLLVSRFARIGDTPDSPPLQQPLSTGWTGKKALGHLLDQMETVQKRVYADRHVMEERQQELLMLLSTMDEGILVLDRQLRLVRINPFAARLFGIDPRESLGKTINELVCSARLLELLDLVMGGQSCEPEEILLYAPSNLNLKFSVSKLPVPAGSPGRIMILVNDLSNLRKLEEVRKDFVANVSHELRTPITAIRGFAETLMGDHEALSGDHQHFVRVIHRQSLRLQAIIEDLLSLSRIEQTGGAIGREEGPARELVLNAFEVCRFQADKRKTSMDLGGDDFICSCNRPLVEQALVNLVNNAIIHCPPGSRITVQIEQDGPDSIFRVRDNGPGIPAKDQSRLFERFYRVDKARSRDAGGTGLGLAIVRHIAMAHGGTVSLHSIPGRGSTFTLRIPRPGTAGSAPESIPPIPPESPQEY